MIWQMYRPAPVFAVQLTRENRDELSTAGIPHMYGLVTSNKYGDIVLCKFGDYIVKDSDDTHTVISAEAFANSYSPV